MGCDIKERGAARKAGTAGSELTLKRRNRRFGEGAPGKAPRGRHRSAMMSQSASSAAAPRRRWLLFLPFALVVLLAAAWTAVWFYAAARAEPEMAGWRKRERQAGRAQDCASPSIGGYPFRIEVRCGGASFELKGTPTLQLKLPLAVAAVQIYDPKLLIGEFTGPLEIS